MLIRDLLKKTTKFLTLTSTFNKLYESQFLLSYVLNKNLIEIILNKYLVIPGFKAGMHVGMATVGEIGILKKEIAFSGDVLNTTSRIQNECNKYNTDLLISEELLNMLEIGLFEFDAH